MWNGKLLGGVLLQYHEPTVGLCLVVVLAAFYVAVTAGAAWGKIKYVGHFVPSPCLRGLLGNAPPEARSVESLFNCANR